MGRLVVLALHLAELVVKDSVHVLHLPLQPLHLLQQVVTTADAKDHSPHQNCKGPIAHISPAPNIRARAGIGAYRLAAYQRMQLARLSGPRAPALARVCAYWSEKDPVNTPRVIASQKSRQLRALIDIDSFFPGRADQ